MGTPNIDLIILISKSLKIKYYAFSCRRWYKLKDFSTKNLIIDYNFSVQYIYSRENETFWKTKNSFKDHAILLLVLIFLYVLKNKKWR